MSGGKRNHEEVSATRWHWSKRRVRCLRSPPDRSHISDTVGSRCGQRSELRGQAPCQWSRASRKSRAPDVRRGSRERVPYRNGGYGNARRDRNHQNSNNVHSAALRARGQYDHPVQLQ